jgi:hypothetical protein
MRRILRLFLIRSSTAAQAVLICEMEVTPRQYQYPDSGIGVYDCEIHLKFRLLEDKEALRDRDRLLEVLLDAFSCGPDEFLEALQVEVDAREISEVDAPPEMRRQLIRLRNSRDLA